MRFSDISDQILHIVGRKNHGFVFILTASFENQLLSFNLHQLPHIFYHAGEMNEAQNYGFPFPNDRITSHKTRVLVRPGSSHYEKHGGNNWPVQGNEPCCERSVCVLLLFIVGFVSSCRANAFALGHQSVALEMNYV